ncbi:type VII secretion target [Umezawaea sp. Da 62-37]|uniref:type VII secretion target n=1 Tax=Umezawaea sp. Da 62-37 TaxID=3075927 RepID=UPI0028F71556|nr:type VII secretion target [Umezawaea sp. Da 62-37]WNV82094.1 type VII secretion target [Umezawaea sp. Da 62-37]
MFDSFNVSPADVRAHASAVDQLSQRMVAATNTADPSLSTEAFGIFGSFLAEFILKAAGNSQDILGKATTTVNDMAVGLKEVADLYEAIDRDNALGFLGKANS